MLYTVYFVYFFCGMTQCFEGVFLPEFKTYFGLDYQQQMYTMFAKNIPFLFAGAIGILLSRTGYRRSFVLALLLFAAGTTLLVPGLAVRQYAIVLSGFLLIGFGFNFEMVAGNPLLSALGAPETASSRLNFANALGAVAQIIAPLTLAWIIPASAITVASRVPWMKALFAVLAIALLMTALFVARIHAPAVQRGADCKNSELSKAQLPPRVYYGLAAITLSLGAEAALFGFYRNYLEDPSVGALASSASQRLFTVYFAVFALGRLLASWAQKRIAPSTHLLLNLATAVVFIGTAIVAHGTVAIIVMTAMGFWVASFYPTLYSLATRGLGDLEAKASGLLTMGFLGAALFPVLQGRIADRFGLSNSYVATLIAYALIGILVLRLRRSAAHL